MWGGGGQITAVLCGRCRGRGWIRIRCCDSVRFLVRLLVAPVQDGKIVPSANLNRSTPAAMPPRLCPMSDLSNFQLPPPSNWAEFEDLCCDLWREIWNAPNTQRNGRSGQPQHGVDVFGRQDRGSWAGVQCVAKDNLANARLSEQELRAMVERAKNFVPSLGQFILATTAPRDARIQELARQLSEQNAAAGLFSVHVWGWEDICSALASHPSVLQRHYPFIVGPPSTSPAETQDRRNLEILLQRVKQFWITDYLEKSLHTEVLLELGKEVRSDAVAHPWERLIELPNQTRTIIPPGRKIVQIFNEFNRALLVLGEPGSGKTITLLQLARDLIARAEADTTFSQPIPVVLNLSSWTNTRQPLADWIVAELTTKYYVPKRIGRPWLEQNRILPLLDGLDEVNVRDRIACVKAINEYAKSFGLSGLVVCSRRAEYTDLPVRLEVNGAVCLQPPTPKEVDKYLASGGAKWEPLRSALKVDAPLAELVQSPLTLNIMVAEYCEGHPISTPRDATIEAKRRQLFDVYVRRMFARKGRGNSRYGEDVTARFLSLLAQRMNQHNLAVFLLEQLQPSWLQTTASRRMYFFASRMIIALPLLLTLATVLSLRPGQPFQLVGFAVVWVFGGLTLCQIPLNALVRRIARTDWASRRNDGDIVLTQTNATTVILTVVLASLFFFAIILGVAAWLLKTLMQSYTSDSVGLPFPTIIAVVTSLWGVAAVLFADVATSHTNLDKEIPPYAPLSWSFTRMCTGAIIGVLLGLGLGFLVSSTLVHPMILNPDRSELLCISMLCAGLAGAALTALQPRHPETQTGLIDVVTLWRSDALTVGTITCFTVGSLLFLVGRCFPVLGPTGGVAFGVFLALVAAMRYGGIAYIKHYTIRTLLWTNHVAPLDYSRFLEHANRLGFLKKVGAGYVFSSRDILNHFAMMDTFDVF
jgi:eukaryotic-like serine/threonine-protein kinase